jgi:pilus assembly protein CpaB
MQMRRQGLLLIGGLVLGLVGAGLVFVYVRGAGSGGGSTETRPVYVAESIIQAGTPATAITGLVTTTDVATNLAPEGAVVDLNQVSGLFTLEEIQPGETLMASMFSTAGTTEAGDLAIPKGDEAVSVTAPLPNAVAEYPAPGDRVSVYATFGNDAAGGVTIKLLSNVLILSIAPRDEGSAQRLAGGNSEPLFVLALGPEDAAKLIYAKENGRIWMTLVPEGQRSPDVPAVSGATLVRDEVCSLDPRSPLCRTLSGPTVGEQV